MSEDKYLFINDWGSAEDTEVHHQIHPYRELVDVHKDFEKVSSFDPSSPIIAAFLQDYNEWQTPHLSP